MDGACQPARPTTKNETMKMMLMVCVSAVGLSAVTALRITDQRAEKAEMR
jgi:hypothetical protein